MQNSNLTEQLTKLGRLHADGALSDEEFNRLKAKLIAVAIGTSNKGNNENDLHLTKHPSFLGNKFQERLREVEQSNGNSVVIIDGQRWAPTIIKGLFLWIYLILFGEMGFLTLYAVFAFFFL